MESHESHHSPDLGEVERRLRAERLEVSALELDGIRQEIHVRAARARALRPRRLTFMKSRMAITMMLVLGALLSTSGVGLAVSGSSDGGAAASQYQSENQNTQQIVPTTTPPQQPPPAAPTQQQSAEAPQQSAQAPSGNAHQVPPITAESAPAAVETAPVAAPEQTVAVQASGSGSLPFTGYNAIPILVGGLALLALGLIMRRQTRAER